MLEIVDLPLAGESAFHKLFCCVGMPRFGRQHQGIAPGGAVDLASFYQLNDCLGHGEPTPLCEWPLIAVTFVARSTCQVAVGGARREWSLKRHDDPAGPAQRIFPYTVYQLLLGDRLVVGRAEWGNYSYLGMVGGVSWSKSESRVLVPPAETGVVGDAMMPPEGERRQESPASFLRSSVSLGAVFRVRPGPEWHPDLLPWLIGPWQVDARSDRSAIRLRPYYRHTLSLPVSCDIRSGPTVDGVVQLTQQGPMILLRERGTVGGYARPWVIQAEDLDRAGQLLPGQAVRFELIDQ